jgi:hypothetical protein
LSKNFEKTGIDLLFFGGRGLGGDDCVTDLLFWGGFGHAGGCLRDRFVILGSLWAGENSYGHVYSFLSSFRVRKTFSRTR